jgi:hydroxyacylglutathione hydrolase
MEIQIISLDLPFRMGSVNCYLVNTGGGFVLVDTGGSNQRAVLEKELESAGCRLGDLKLILLTHGDFDHSGNAAYLRQKYATKIAMHASDSGMVARGDMFYNRKKGNALLRWLVPVFFGFGKAQRFEPDLCLEEGGELSAHGFEAQVLSIPGHSSGSIGLLTPTGDLFCGDLLDNTTSPGLSSIMDDLDAARASVERLKGLRVETVYPGHGRPFAMEEFVKNSLI